MHRMNHTFNHPYLYSHRRLCRRLLADGSENPKLFFGKNSFFCTSLAENFALFLRIL